MFFKVCGIAGLFGQSDNNLIRKMCDKIAHRGPDEDGYYVDEHVSLGMRRLKVIDLSTGKQPIYNEDKTAVVIYNGEIYNYKELRTDLELRGHVFSTASDTEVIVHLYEEYGEHSAEHLRGMFTFAVWDIPKQKLIVSRDRLGIKPLYYYFKDGVFIFGSEIKSLLAHPQVPREINIEALSEYLTYMYVPAPSTIFKEIFKLMPGHTLVCDRNGISTKKYWNLELENQTTEKESEISNKLCFLMEDSVQKHLVSDVPLGVFLSGGLDSGTLVALASEMLPGPLKTFSIGFEDEVYNELAAAKAVAKHFKTEHFEYVVKAPGQEMLEDIVAHFDEPFADSSAIPTYFVSKCAREQVTVALSGDGGDEIFAGYGNYKADKLASYYRKLPYYFQNKVFPYLADALPKNQSNLSKNRQIKKLIETALMTPEDGHIFWLSVFNSEAKRQLLTENTQQGIANLNSYGRFRDYFAECRGEDFLQKCMYVDKKTVLLDDYLQKVDRMSMANSLEVRVPFLDHALVEYASRIPSRLMLKGFKTKSLLREIMKDKLPAQIMKGKKRGFSIPLNKWLQNDFSVYVGEYLSEKTVKRRGYFDHRVVERLVREHLSNHRDNSKELWTLISFEMWHRRVFDNAPT